MSLGLLIFIFPPLYGEGYQVLTDLLNNRSSDAIGTSFLSNILSEGWLLPIFFIGVFFAKVFSMSLTNAGGGVGGTFGPTLFMGGVFGFIIARLNGLCQGIFYFSSPKLISSIFASDQSLSRE